MLLLLYQSTLFQQQVPSTDKKTRPNRDWNIVCVYHLRCVSENFQWSEMLVDFTKSVRKSETLTCLEPKI